MRSQKPITKSGEICAASLLDEELVALRDLPGLLPARHGKKLHFCTVWRWCLTGCRGAVLESMLVGGVLFTSKEAVERFLARINRQPVTRPARRRRAEISAAERRLAAEGL